MKGGGRMKSRKRYLDSVPIEQALSLWLGSLSPKPLAAEDVTVPESVGRVLATPVFARVSSPHYHAAAMDGIAVDATLTFGASEAKPVRLVRGEQFTWVDTGDPLPPSRNAVIMSEDLNWLDDNTAEIIAAASPWQHVRPIGEDIVATELLLPAGHRVRPVDTGALLAAGIWNVPVRRRPVLALIPTGDEIVEPALRLAGGTPVLERGDIIESNTYVQAALAREWGAGVLRYGVIPDSKMAIAGALSSALEHADVVVLNAGSSAGSEDYTAEILTESGEVLVHGVAQRPGKPVVLGRARHGDAWKPVIGVPGYPVSAYLTFCTFVRPLVEALLGLPPDRGETLKATLTRKVSSPAGVEEFLRVKLGRVGGKIIASPISRGAGVITSVVRADGIVRIPRLSEGMSDGADVEVSLLRPAREIENTIVAIGSHDPGLDLLGSMMMERYGVGLSSSHAGSLGGLMALRRNEAHAAGTHLIDEVTGEYNTPYISRLLPGRRVLLVTLARRQQGLMVAPGNPKGIRSLSELRTGAVRLVNRQRGAGTRILLDLLLKKEGMDARTIPGYEHEEYTHTGVAAAVAGGVADCGLGVLAAARALGLDFIPVASELYELAILEENVLDPRVKAMLLTLKSQEFEHALSGLGGYDTNSTGQERWWPLDR